MNLRPQLSRKDLHVVAMPEVPVLTIIEMLTKQKEKQRTI